MPIRENEIELLARAMIARHGANAAKKAAARLNQMIDRGDLVGRDCWACIVRAIHEELGFGAGSGIPELGPRHTSTSCAA